VQTSFLTTVFLPVALGVIMLGLGLGLTVADFTRVVRFPRAVLTGLACQMLLLPVIGLFVAKGFDLPPELAVGLMLLAASPGGATANLFSHLARGDVALNITLTAVNSVLSTATLPFIVGFSMTHFMGADSSVPLPPDKVIQVFAIVLVPVGIGMAMNAYLPALARRLARPVKILSLLFLSLVIAAAIAKERSNIGGFIQQVGLAALVFNVISMAIGYTVPRLLRVDRRQAIATGMEIGIHNSTLAMTVAMSPMLLDNSVMAIPAAVYGIVMFFTAGLFAFLVSRRPDA